MIAAVPSEPAPTAAAAPLGTVAAATISDPERTTTTTPTSKPAATSISAAAPAAPAGPAGPAATPTPAAPAAPAASAPDILASRFTLAVLPDTQYYSRFSAGQFQNRYGTDPFATQTQWLAEHAAELKIPFVTHLGDIVDQVWQEAEWIAADRAMRNLETAKVPYSILAGNHDVLSEDPLVVDTAYDPTEEPFPRWFGTERSARQSTYQGSDPTGFSQYHIFEAEGQEFMVLALPWRASDATFTWADAAMAAHPRLPVILTTHQLIDIENDGASPKETEYGREVWNKLIRSNDQIFLTLNGHFHGAARQTKMNDAGHPVTQLVIDHQMTYEGGDGYLALFEFDLTNNRISVMTGSPWVASKSKELLISADQAVLAGPNQEFAIDIDFAKRFAAFAPGFTAGAATTPSLTERVRDILLQNFVAPGPPPTAWPGSVEDYPDVDGTLAHWRMNGREGVMTTGVTLPDVAEGADLTRAALASSFGSATARGSVTIVAGSDPYSSDGAALCFSSDDTAANRFGSLARAAAAVVNTAAPEHGYTVETFIKTDTWTHVAVVNDAATAVTTTYVDGSPVTRTKANTVGAAHRLEDAMASLTGSDASDDREVDGPNVCIGETRVVDHALAADKWLTARADLTGLLVDIPVEPVPAAERKSILTGTGLAGATVTVDGALAGTTTVRWDGAWTIDLGGTLAAGDYSFGVRQSFGTRSADAVDGRMTILGPVPAEAVNLIPLLVTLSPSRWTKSAVANVVTSPVNDEPLRASHPTVSR